MAELNKQIEAADNLATYLDGYRHAVARDMASPHGLDQLGDYLTDLLKTFDSEMVKSIAEDLPNTD